MRKLKTKALLLAVAAAGVGVITPVWALEADPQGACKKKYVAFGWEFSYLTPQDFVDHVDKFAKTPLDGVGFNINGDKAAGRRYQCFREQMTTPRWTRESLANLIPSTRMMTSYPCFRESFVSSLKQPQKRLAWTDDEAWDVVSNNLRVVTWYAREGGLRGIHADVEDYYKQRQFFRTDDDPPYDELVKVVRRRAADVFRGIFEEYPDITVFMYWIFSDAPYRHVETDLVETLRQRGDLWPAFVNGILDVLPPTATLVDGEEDAYKFEASRHDFLGSYTRIMNWDLPLVEKENRTKYLSQVSPSFGQYLDSYVNDEKNSWYMGPVEGSRLRHFAANVRQATSAAKEYVWFWGERGCWIDWSAELRSDPERLTRVAGSRVWNDAIPGGLNRVFREIKDPDGVLLPRVKSEIAGGSLKPVPGDYMTWKRPPAKGKPDQGGFYRADGALWATNVLDGCYHRRFTSLKEGDLFYIVGEAKGDAATAAVPFLSKGRFLYGPKKFPLAGAPDADGWRKVETLVRIPDGVDEMALTLGFKDMKDGDVAGFRDFCVYRIDTFASAPLPTAKIDRGGTTFDLAAISAERFPVAEGGASGRCAITERGSAAPVPCATAKMPDRKDWIGQGARLSFRYRFRLKERGNHKGARLHVSFYRMDGGKKVETQPPWEPRIYDTAGEWRTFSTMLNGLRHTAEFGDLAMNLNGGCGELEIKDFRFLPETPDPHVVGLRLAGMGQMDGAVEIGAGQPLLLSFEWRATECRVREAAALDWTRWEFRLELPKGIRCLDVPAARKGRCKIEERKDGTSSVTFGQRGEIRPHQGWDAWQSIGCLVENRLAAGEPVGDGVLRLFHEGKEMSKPVVVRFRSGEPVQATSVPVEYVNGICSATDIHLFNDAGAADRYAAFMCGAGLRACGGRDPAFRAALKAHGVKKFYGGSSWIANGYSVGTFPPSTDKRPADQRFQPYDWSAVPSYRTNLFVNSTCPVAVYREASYFRERVVPYIAEDMKGNAGMMVNWEPDAYFGHGCACANCRAEFAKYCRLDEADVAKDWPKCVMPGGRFADRRNAFRSWQHGMVVKTIDKYVRKFSGGGKSDGFIPEIVWAELSTGTHDNPMQAEVDVYEYAGSLKWINPWGPYCWWDASNPYCYEKRLPVAPFAAAKDVRENVNRRFPEGKRPKLVAFPSGSQGQYWMTTPEWLGMAMDSFFYNGWEATHVYYFPRGYDARYWRAFADATSRAGRGERYVFGGTRTDDKTLVRTVAEYAANCRQVTGFLPSSTNMSPLQVVSYDRDGQRLVAALNFWEKGEAFFRLSLMDLKPGRYTVVSGGKTLWTKAAGTHTWTSEELARGLVAVVGAARTVDFEIVPAADEGATGGAKEELTQDAVRARYRERRAALAEAAERDRASEAVRGEVFMDTLPEI